MSEMQQQVLHSALGRAQREMQNEVQGTWCDALACLLALEWPRARKHLLTPVPQSTSVVVQAWMQAGFTATPLQFMRFPDILAESHAREHASTSSCPSPGPPASLSKLGCRWAWQHIGHQC